VVIRRKKQKQCLPGELEVRLCIAAEKKWSLRTNCPTYNDWSGCILQVKATQNQAFIVLTVPETVGNGTVQTVKCSIKTIARSLELSLIAFQSIAHYRHNYGYVPNRKPAKQRQKSDEECLQLFHCTPPLPPQEAEANLGQLLVLRHHNVS